MIEPVVGEVLEPRFASAAGSMRGKSPGLSPRHYAPKGEMILFEGESVDVRAAMNLSAARFLEEGRRVGALAAEEDFPHFEAADLILASVGPEKDLPSVARQLFSALRRLEEQDPDVILARDYGHEGVGAAIHERLKRAAGGRTVFCSPAD